MPPFRGRSRRSTTTPRGTGFFLTAAVCGLAHAAASAYWAFGGTWLLETVGEFAVQMQRDGGTEMFSCWAL